jgi:23S rRNA pseudouridine1911/1915/1917 synthase
MTSLVAPRKLSVPSDSASPRLDVFLMRYLPCSRRVAQRAIAAGLVRVNGRRARKGDVLQSGDLVAIAETQRTAGELRPNPHLAVHVLYEDEAVIVIDKPAGIPSHALRSDETDTAANFLLARDPGLAIAGRSPLEAGLAHRLDTGTSGILLAARSAAAYAALRQQFTARQVEKTYLALVEGNVQAGGEVLSPLAPAPHNRRKMRIVARMVSGARPAQTSYRPLEELGGSTLLEVHIRTGVRHQIRVHLAALGHAVVGDALYGHARSGAPARHLLHAAGLAFVHPTHGRRIEIRSPLPGDFARFVANLRAATKD